MTNNRVPKRRIAIKFENLTEDLKTEFNQKYPRGYSDYMIDLFTVDKPDGTSFHAISLESEDAIYLVKMNVKVDSYKDIEKDFFENDELDEQEENPIENEVTEMSSEDDE